MFVFEAANRIVVEKPEYSHATYFFELEQPLPVHAQVKQHPQPKHACLATQLSFCICTQDSAHAAQTLHFTSTNQRLASGCLDPSSTQGSLFL